MSVSAPFARVVFDYDGILSTFRDRAEMLAISRLELDRLAGLSESHSSKLLQPIPSKVFGPVSFGPTLQALGLIVMIVEDPGQRDRTLARRQAFDATNRRVGNRNCAEGSKRKKAVQQSGSEGAIQPPHLVHDEAAAARVTRLQPTFAHLRVVQMKRAKSKDVA